MEPRARRSRQRLHLHPGHRRKRDSLPGTAAREAPMTAAARPATVWLVVVLLVVSVSTAPARGGRGGGRAEVSRAADPRAADPSASAGTQRGAAASAAAGRPRAAPS